LDPRQTAPPRDPFRNQRRAGSGDQIRRDQPGFEEPPRQEARFREDYGAPPPRSRGRGPDPAALFVLLDAVRRAVPGELEQRVTGLIREFLLTLRSLIDWYLERLDRSPREPEVEEIRID
jgi:hypothetical protein